MLNPFITFVMVWVEGQGLGLGLGFGLRLGESLNNLRMDLLIIIYMWLVLRRVSKTKIEKKANQIK